MAGIGTHTKKTIAKISQGKSRIKYPTSVNLESCLLVHSFHFNLAGLIFLKQFFIQFCRTQKHEAKISVCQAHTFLYLGIPSSFKSLIVELISNNE